jgi:Zn-dependent M16 (insulinase) family peptidase
MHGFELVKAQIIPEINTHARLYRHIKTGAQLVSMENDDENKVFGVGFYTPMEDSTGVAHILEHSVLCGSRKYPLKEPFVELIKGSLNTFVNAFTFVDKTVYPVASQNVKDFYNLIDVYMDAVFYPRITREIFQQEGWHYELDAPDDPMIFKGVVFNEMKGGYSSADRMLGVYSRMSLFPGGTRYGIDSGGDPENIPDLTYDYFKNFHSRYYHPSNGLIWFYGDDDPEERLHYLNQWLNEFDAAPPPANGSHPTRFSEPQRKAIPFDSGEDNKKGYATVNWLLTQTSEIENNLGLHILSYILTGSPASPLRKALIDSGLGEGLAGDGIDDQMQEMAYSTGLKGIDPDNAGKVEQLILETLATLARDGIEPDMVEAALNTVEFRMRENNTGSYPRGIAMMIDAMSTWLYGGDPLAVLAFEAPLNAIKARVASGERYFESLIEQFLINNPHRTTVTLYPDPALRSRREAAEKARLDQARSAMSQDEIMRVIEETKALRKAQETPDSPEALATLPTLTLADLDKKNKTIPIDVSEHKGTKIVYHDLFTNGICTICRKICCRMSNYSAVPCSKWAPIPKIMSSCHSGSGAKLAAFTPRRLVRWSNKRIGRLRGCFCAARVLPRRWMICSLSCTI